MKQIEIENLNKIYDLTTQISTTREEQKADQLIRLTSQHRKILAYDSTLITTAYIKKLVKDRVASKIDVVQISGEATEKERVHFKNDSILVQEAPTSVSPSVPMLFQKG